MSPCRNEAWMICWWKILLFLGHHCLGRFSLIPQTVFTLMGFSRFFPCSRDLFSFVVREPPRSHCGERPRSARMQQPEFQSLEVSARRASGCSQQVFKKIVESQEGGTRTPQAGFRSQDFLSENPQPRFLSQESLVKTPHPRSLCEGSSAKTLCEDCSAKISPPRFLSQDFSATTSQFKGFWKWDSRTVWGRALESCWALGTWLVLAASHVSFLLSIAVCDSTTWLKRKLVERHPSIHL